jgi:hypothetical protein
MLTVEVKKLKHGVEMFKMFCEVVRPLCGGQVRAVAVHRDDGQK